MTFNYSNYTFKDFDAFKNLVELLGKGISLSDLIVLRKNLLEYHLLESIILTYGVLDNEACYLSIFVDSVLSTRLRNAV